MEDVTVPARSKAVVLGRIEMSRTSPESADSVWTTEARQLRTGVMVARAVIPPRLNEVPILVLNLSRVPLMIRSNTLLSELSIAQCMEEGRDDPVDTNKATGFKHLAGLVDGVDVSLSESQRTSLLEILHEYADIFTTGELDLGSTTIAQHRIDTGDALLMRQSLRRQPWHLLDKIDAHVSDMIKVGVKEASCSPWTSNLVVVKKKNNSLRFCVDYRKLNFVTRRDAYPLPRIDECLDGLSGARYFIAFDLRSAYHQVLMHSDDADKTNFIVRTGTYRFKRMPFGLCNAGSTFQRVMDLALNGLNFNMCLVYIDDIIVFSATIEKHMERFKLMFDRIRTANLKFKASKCCLLRTEVSFLGHVVIGEGVSTDPNKIKSVKKWPVPQDVKEVRSFLGLASYYRRFFPSFAAIALF